MNADNKFFQEFSDVIDRINKEMKNTVNSRVPLIEDMSSHSLLGGGKRLRPLLFILCCRLCQYNGEDIYRLSTIFEYVHTASLLHDDVLDNADIRRKKPSANNVWGNHAAVLEGDYLYSSSLGVALDTGNLKFLRKLTDTGLRMTEGQFMELIHTDDWSITREKYMDIINEKTAALISAACSCGAIISGADRIKERALSDFGNKMGIAFQLMDDLLDYSSTEEVLGKPVGKDLKEGKITLPHIYILSEIEADERARFENPFKERSALEKDYKDFIDIVRGRGILDRVLSEARRYIENARACLNIFPDSPAKNSLVHISEYVVERKF